MGGVGLVEKVDLEKSDSTRLFMNGVLLRTIANGMIREFVLVVTRDDLGSQHVLQTQPCAYPTNISSTPALSGERERDACHFTHAWRREHVNSTLELFSSRSCRMDIHYFPVLVGPFCAYAPG